MNIGRGKGGLRVVVGGLSVLAVAAVVRGHHDECVRPHPARMQHRRPDHHKTFTPVVSYSYCTHSDNAARQQ